MTRKGIILAYLLDHPQGSRVEDVAAYVLERFPGSPIKQNVAATVATLAMMRAAGTATLERGETVLTKGRVTQSPHLWRATVSN